MDHIDINNIIVNLTDGTLHPSSVTILSKGLIFVRTKNLRSNLKQIISGIEPAMRHLSADAAKEMQQETVCILRHSKAQTKPQ
jgi:hypothetical protein